MQLKGEREYHHKGHKDDEGCEPATINHFKASALCPNQSSSPSAMAANWPHSMLAASSVADPDNEDADILIKKRHRRGDGSADVLTAREIKKKNTKKHAKLQTIFRGNNTTMHNHIAHIGM